jgi:hypothetical protein
MGHKPASPAAPIARNHSIMIGPNTFPTRSVPRRCTANSNARTIKVIGSTSPETMGEATSIPSTADSPEIAGVMTLSPKNNAAPSTPSPKRGRGHARWRRRGFAG